MTEKTCPLCKNKMKAFQINLTEGVILCSDKNCPYPFNEGDLEYVDADKIMSTIFEETQPVILQEDNEKNNVEESTSYKKIFSNGAAATYIKSDKPKQTISSMPCNYRSQSNTSDIDIEDKNLMKEIRTVLPKNTKKSRTTLRNIGWLEKLNNLQKKENKKYLTDEELKLINDCKSEKNGASEPSLNIKFESNSNILQVKIEIPGETAS